MDELAILHMKNKYFIEVRKKKNGCIIKNPANIFLEPQYQTEITDYTLQSNILTVNNQDILIPTYAQRIIVLSDLLMKVQKLKISPSLIFFFDGLEKRNTILDILPAPIEEKDVRRDAHLFLNSAGIVLGEYDREDAIRNEVVAGFDLIYSVYAKGGI